MEEKLTKDKNDTKTETPLNKSELKDLLAAEQAGANVRAVQSIYGLPFAEKNPYKENDPLYQAYHQGYEMETLVGGKQANPVD
jgi:hypothetical protein